MSRMRLRCPFAHVALALATIAVAAPAPAVAQRFKAGVDLVVIDVSVVDRSGEPVRDLRREDFSVFVANRPRALQSVEFITAESTEGTGAPPSGRDADASTNTLPTSGRLLLIVIDEANLGPASANAVVRAAEGLLGALSRGDLVGLARLPEGGGTEFTTNRARLIEALRQVRGTPPRPAAAGVHVYLSEALDFEQGARDQWPRALARECGNPRDPTYRMCQTSMELEARSVLSDETWKMTATVSGLHALLKGLEAANAPVTVVFISESLFVARDPAAFSGLASDGAARVSLHVVRPLPAGVSMAFTGPPVDPSGDDALRSSGLEILAAQFRGAFHRMVSTGEDVFTRIRRELSGYYLLGIDAIDSDRRSANRPVRVEVRRQHVTVRARPAFNLATVARREVLTPDQRLRAMLGSLVPTRGLPMAVSSRVLPDARAGRVRILISAEIGEGVERQTPTHVGLVVVDRNGAVASSNAATVMLAPSRASRPSPALFSTSLVLEPGEYFLRLAAIDAHGAAGSVNHDLGARLGPTADGLELSDLIVSGEPAPGRFPVFSPAAIVDGRRVAGVLEIRYPREGLQRGTVRFDIAAADHNEPVMSVEADAQSGPGALTTQFSRVMSLDNAPGGSTSCARRTRPAASPASSRNGRFGWSRIRSWPSTTSAVS
jgi:VWFA-related protein